MNDLDLNLFWSNVKKTLKAKNVLQQDLCNGCGFNLGSFKHKIAENGTVSLIEAFKIAEFLGVSIDSLCGSLSLPEDVSDAVSGLLLLTPEQREPLIAIMNGQVQYWTKVYKQEEK